MNLLLKQLYENARVFARKYPAIHTIIFLDWKQMQPNISVIRVDCTAITEDSYLYVITHSLPCGYNVWQPCIQYIQWNVSYELTINE